MDPSETEDLRRKIIASREETEEELRDRYGPGTFGCHEALHMVSFLEDTIDRELLAHGAIAARPDWFAMVHQALGIIHRVYRAIGAEHLETDRPPEAT